MYNTVFFNTTQNRDSDIDTFYIEWVITKYIIPYSLTRRNTEILVLIFSI